MGNLFNFGTDAIGHSLGDEDQFLPGTDLHFDLDSHMSNLESLSNEYASSLLEEINLSHEVETSLLHPVDNAVHSLVNYARDEVPTIFKCLASDSESTLCMEDKSDMVISNFDHLSTDADLAGLHESVWQDNSHNDDGLDAAHSHGADWDTYLGIDYNDEGHSFDVNVDTSSDDYFSQNWQDIDADNEHHDLDTGIHEDGTLGDLDQGLDDHQTFDHYERAASGFDYPHAVGDPGMDATYWHYQGTDHTCAVVSQETILNELTGHHHTEGELLQDAVANGWCTDKGTSMENMHKILEANGVETKQSEGNTLDDITAQLEQGNKVIVAINGNDVWDYEHTLRDVNLRDYQNIPLSSPNHAVVVTGVDYSIPGTPMVILNDSGNPNGAAEIVPAGVFMVAWEHSNNYMVNTTGRLHESHPPTAQTAMLGDNFENAAYNASWADYYRQKAEYDASYGY
jgi:Peptidase_C39 like family